MRSARQVRSGAIPVLAVPESNPLSRVGRGVSKRRTDVAPDQGSGEGHGADVSLPPSQVVVGPRYLRAEVTMDRIPLFARGGAVIPMWTEAPASTAGYQPTAVELHLFIPVADGTYRSALQEDDGTTFAANAGTRLGTSFEVTRVGRQITVSAEVDGDGYESFARDQFQIVVHGAVATPWSSTARRRSSRTAESRCPTMPGFHRRTPGGVRSALWSLSGYPGRRQEHRPSTAAWSARLARRAGARRVARSVGGSRWVPTSLVHRREQVAAIRAAASTTPTGVRCPRRW